MKEISQNSVDRALEGAIERLILYVASGKDTTGSYEKARDALVKWGLTHADVLERSVQAILHDEDERSSLEYKNRLFVAQLMFRVPEEVITFVSSFLIGCGKHGGVTEDDMSHLKLIRDRAMPLAPGR